MDGGAGRYLILKTDRWAIDVEDLDDFVAALHRFAAEFCVKPDAQQEAEDADRRSRSAAP